MRSFEETNKNTRYEGKLVGNSPEFCRGLDAHEFSDLELSITYHTSLTRMKYDNDDVRKFKTGTPNEVWSTVVRCWETEPTSDRIVEDILAFPRVFNKL